MEDSLFRFFDEISDHEEKDGKKDRPKSELQIDGCDNGFDFKYETPESDDSRTAVYSSTSPVRRVPSSSTTSSSSITPVESEDEDGEDLVQQLAPGYSSSSDSDNDESLYSPSSRKSSTGESYQSDTFDSESSTEETVQILPTIRSEPRLHGFHSSRPNTKSGVKRFENRFKKDETVSSENSGQSCSSKDGKYPNTTVPTDKKETMQPRPILSGRSLRKEHIKFPPVANKKATLKSIKYGNRAKLGTTINDKKLPPIGKVVIVPHNSEHKFDTIAPVIKTVTLAGNYGARHQDLAQTHQMVPNTRLPSIPIRLKSETFFQNGELVIRIYRDGKKYLCKNNMKVNILIINKDEKSYRLRRRPIQRKRKGATKKSKNKANWKPVDRNVVENRANWPEFNTTLSEEANKRYRQRLGL